MSIGLKIKELRTEKGWSQKELAEKLKKSQQTISAMEKDLIKFDTKLIDKLATIFGITPKYFNNEKDYVREVLDRMTKDGLLDDPDNISDDVAKMIIDAVKIDFRLRKINKLRKIE